MIMAGTAMPATRPIPTGAPTNVPSCHRIFFFRDQGFLPQNVQPDGLQGKKCTFESCVMVTKFITIGLHMMRTGINMNHLSPTLKMNQLHCIRFLL
jgi:hypothetical protein